MNIFYLVFKPLHFIYKLKIVANGIFLNELNGYNVFKFAQIVVIFFQKKQKNAKGSFHYFIFVVLKIKNGAQT